MKKEVYSPSLCLMNEIVELYYVYGMNQLDIAMKLGISKPTVSRLLQSAQRSGMLSIQINQPYLDCLKLQRQLLEKYPIKEIHVVPVLGDGTNELEIKKTVAREGARHLQRILNSDQLLGLAWGGTVHHMIQVLNPCQKKRIEVITMQGNLSACGEEYDVKSLVRRAAMAFSGKRYVMGTSGYLSNIEQTEKVKACYQYKEFCKKFEDITISLAGAGAWKPDAVSVLAPAEAGYISREEREELKRKNVVADFILHFIDEEGNEIESEIKKRTMSIELDLYKQIPYKIVLLSGVEKAYAAKGILKGGYADILFLDYQLAKKLYYL